LGREGEGGKRGSEKGERGGRLRERERQRDRDREKQTQRVAFKVGTRQTCAYLATCVNLLEI